MNKMDRLLKSIETKSNVIEQQEPVTLDSTPMGARVRPTYAHKPEQPTYTVIGKEFQPEIENNILYSVAYYQLQDMHTGEIHNRLVASYEIVMA